MSVTPSAVAAAPAYGQFAARATDGCAVTVAGREVLRVGAHAVYRVDVHPASRVVELIADGRALSFRCQAAGDGGHPERPGPRFGWTAAAPGRGAEVPVRVGDVLTVCLHDRDATAAVEAINRAVARDAERTAANLRAGAPPGPSGQPARRAADAWQRAAARLMAATARAGKLRRVPARPLRDEFLRQVIRGETTASALAWRVGWRWKAVNGRRAHGDSTRVLRRLGLAADPSDRRPTQRRCRASASELALLADLDDVTATVSYDVAVALCRGLGRDPADFGWL